MGTKAKSNRSQHREPDWDAFFREQFEAAAQSSPDDALTCAEVADKLGISKEAARNHLKRGIVAGAVQVVKAQRAILCGAGHRQSFTAYRLVK